MTSSVNPFTPSSSVSSHRSFPLSPLPMSLEPQDSASPVLYFKTLLKIINFARYFFAYVAKKTFKVFNLMQEKILDFLVLHFPKLANVRHTLEKPRDPNTLELQFHIKSKRHADDLQERLKMLKVLLENDANALQNGKITQETHLMRYLQIAAIKLAYRLKVAPSNQRIPLPRPYLDSTLDLDDEQNSYTINLRIDNKGLVAYGLEPPERSSAPPLLLIKGTSTTNLYQILADLNEKIGSKAFKANKEKLFDWIEPHSTKVIVAGHSLGGAIAQIIGRKYHAFIQTVVTFASPSPGKQLVRKFKIMQKEEREKIKDEKEPQIPKVYHFINEGDLIPCIGGFTSIPGRTFELEAPKTLTLKERHSYMGDIDPVTLKTKTNQITDQVLLEEQKVQKRFFLRLVLEIGRWAFRFFLTWAVRLLAKKQTRIQKRSLEMKELRSCVHPPDRRYSVF